MVTEINELKIKKLLNELQSEDVGVRHNARLELVKIGTPIIDFLIELDYSKDKNVKWEVMKALGQIADPDTIPLLLEGLCDDDFEIRWLAAEGLIEIGKESVKPILDELFEKPDAMFLRHGAHHVLHNLETMELFEDKYDLISVLNEVATASAVIVKVKETLRELDN